MYCFSEKSQKIKKGEKKMSAFSYKEMLTNQLMVFINQRIAQSKDMQEKS